MAAPKSESAFLNSRRVRTMKDITQGVRQLRVETNTAEGEAPDIKKDPVGPGVTVTLKGGLASPMLLPPRAAPAGKSWKSSRRKDLSHILLRGLWRWKDSNQAKKRRKEGHGGNQSGSETGISSETRAHLQHSVGMYRGGLLSEGGHGVGAAGDATGSESSAEEGLYYSSGGGSGRGSIKSSTGKHVVRRVRRLPPLSPGSLAPLADRMANQTGQQAGRPGVQHVSVKLHPVPSQEGEGEPGEAVAGQENAAPHTKEAAAQGAVQQQGVASMSGKRESQHGSRPTSATLSHSNSGVFLANDSGYGSELGYGGDGETGYGDESYGDEFSVGEEEEWEKEGPPPAEYWRLWEALVAAGGLRGRHRGGRGGEPIKDVTIAELMRKCDTKDGMAELINVSHARVKRYQQRLRRRRRQWANPLPPHPQPHPVRRETEESSGDCSLHSLRTSVEGTGTGLHRSQEARTLGNNVREPHADVDMDRDTAGR